MKYTGKLYKDIKNEALIPRFLLDKINTTSAEKAYLLKRLHRHYSRQGTWAKQFVKAVNSQDGGRTFLTVFFCHWLQGLRFDLLHEPRRVAARGMGR